MPNLQEVLSSTMLEQHAMRGSPEARRKKTKNSVISNNAKDESNTLMRGNVNLAKKFGMEKMTMEIDG